MAEGRVAYRILSLDGGGTWALLQVMALQQIYGDVAGHKVLQDFDLAIANSGGSIVLAGLIRNMTLPQLLDFFHRKADRSSVFAKKTWFERAIWLGKGPKYSTKAKLIGLSRLLGTTGDTPMGDLSATGNLPDGPSGSPTKVMFTAFDYDRERSELFRSFPTKAGAPASKISLTDAVHASTNAPVIYFDEPAECGPVGEKRRYWDGAIAGYNNPVMAAVTETLVLGIARETIHVRLIGTATVRLAPYKDGAQPEQLFEPHKRLSALGEVFKLASAVTDDPPDAASYLAFVALGNAVTGAVQHGGSVVRLNPSVQPVWRAGSQSWGPPPGYGLDQFKVLCDLGMDAVEDQQVDWIDSLGQHWIAGNVPNQPLRMGTNMSCQIGDATFAAARSRW